MPSLDRFRHQLATIDALPQLSLVGLLAGCITALVMMLFRELITLLSLVFMGGAPEGAYQQLPWEWRTLLPLLGSMLIAAIIHFSRKKHTRVGIAHVIARLDWNQGRLPLGNMLHQFFCGAIAIASGHSIGREGPAVHLGAAAGSLLGQSMGLPNNSLRILVACGTSAAISAAFNTPVAGVIFALEVLLIEYTFAGFLPVMLASVSAASITQLIYGADPAFLVPGTHTDQLRELPLVIVTGMAMGGLGALFCRMTITITTMSQHIPVSGRLFLAAVVTGALATAAPDIMGVGYGTMNTIMTEHQTLSFLLLLLACKLLASTTSLGLGVPGGLIGPTLFLGAAGGIICATLLSRIPGLETHSTGFHAMVGMSALLGAVLQAPLTALVTVVEMTHNPSLLFPAMLAIVVASLTTRLLLRKPGMFEQILGVWGLSRICNPVHKAMARIGISSLMDSDFLTTEHQLSRPALNTLLKDTPGWLLITDSGNARAVMPVESLTAYLGNHTDAETDSVSDQNEMIDLLEIPVQRYQTTGVNQQSSVFDAWEVMGRKQVDSLYIINKKRSDRRRVTGIVTREELERFSQV